MTLIDQILYNRIDFALIEDMYTEIVFKITIVITILFSFASVYVYKIVKKKAIEIMKNEFPNEEILIIPDKMPLSIAATSFVGAFCIAASIFPFFVKNIDISNKNYIYIPLLFKPVLLYVAILIFSSLCNVRVMLKDRVRVFSFKMGKIHCKLNKNYNEIDSYLHHALTCLTAKKDREKVIEIIKNAQN